MFSNWKLNAKRQTNFQMSAAAQQQLELIYLYSPTLTLEMSPWLHRRDLSQLKRNLHYRLFNQYMHYICHKKYKDLLVYDFIQLFFHDTYIESLWSHQRIDNCKYGLILTHLIIIKGNISNNWAIDSNSPIFTYSTKQAQWWLYFARLISR